MSWISFFCSLMMAVSAVGMVYRHHLPYMAIFIAWTSGWAAGVGFATWCVVRRREAACK